MKISWLLKLVVFTLGLSAQSAIAGLVAFTAEGRLGWVPSGLSPYFSFGDHVRYELVFDVDSPPDSFDVASGYESAVKSFKVTIGTFTAIAPSVNELTVWNSSTIDGMRVDSRLNDGLTSSLLGEFKAKRIAFQLFDFDGAWLDSAKIPTHYLSPFEYENQVFRVDFDNTNSVYLTGRFDTFTISSKVAEPSTLLLVLVFLVYFCVRLRV